MKRNENPNEQPGSPDPRVGDWPVDLAADSFAAPAPEPFAVGAAVRLVRLPPTLAQLSPAQRRLYGAIEGEIFEVAALTLPGELAIARRLDTPGGGLQTLFVEVDCVEAAEGVPGGRLARSSAPPPARRDEADDDAWCDELAGFRRGECARLVRLPRDIRRLPRRERREYQALIGECFEIWGLFWPDEVHLARQIESENGLPAIDVFIMPIDCIEPAEWDAEEDSEVMAQ